MAEDAGNKKGSTNKSARKKGSTNKSARNATTAAKEYAKISSSIQISDESRLKILEAIENKTIKTTAELHKQVILAEKSFTLEKQRTTQLQEQNNFQQEQTQNLEDQTDFLQDITKLSSQIIDAKENLVSLDYDSVKLLHDQVKINKQHIQQQIESGNLTGDALKQAKDNLGLLEKQEVSTSRMLDLFNDEGFQRLRVGFEQSAEAAKGIGDSVNSLVSSLPGGSFLAKAFGIDELGAKLEKTRKEGFAKITTELVNSKDSVEDVTKNLKSGGGLLKTLWLPALLGVGAGLFALGKNLLSMADEQDTAAEKITEQTGMTHAASERLLKSTKNRATKLNEQLASTQDIVDVQSAMIKQMGPLSQMSNEVASQVTETALAYGLTNEKAGELQATLVQSGLSQQQSAEFQKEIAADATKEYLNASEVMQDMADSHAEAAKYLAGQPKELKKAGIQAAKMGMSIKDLVGMADHLLSIEDSLSAQYEFQALSGTQINLDKARALALDGKLAEAAKETSDQLKASGITQEKFAKMKSHEKQALASATGLEVDQIDKMLALEKQRGKLTDEQIQAATGLNKTAEELKGMTAEQIQDELAAANESKKRQKDMADAMESLKENLMPIATALSNAIGGLARGVNAIVQGFNSLSGPWKWFIGGLATIAVAYLLWNKRQKRVKAEQLDTNLKQMQYNELLEKSKEKQAGLANAAVSTNDAHNTTVTNTQAIADNTQTAVDNATTLAEKAAETNENLQAAAESSADMASNMENAAAAEVSAAGEGDKSKGLFGRAKDKISGIAGGIKDKISGIGGGIGGGIMGAASSFMGSDIGGMIKEKGIESLMGSVMGVGDLAINPNGGPVVASPREGGIYQGTKNDGVSMSPGHGGTGGGGAAIDYNALGAAVAAAIAANPPQIHMDGNKVSQSVTANQSRNKGL